jgi:hypothetical protein
VNEIEGNEVKKSLRKNQEKGKKKTVAAANSDAGVERNRASCIMLGYQRNGSGYAPCTASEVLFHLRA